MFASSAQQPDATMRQFMAQLGLERYICLFEAEELDMQV